MDFHRLLSLFLVSLKGREDLGRQPVFMQGVESGHPLNAINLTFSNTLLADKRRNPRDPSAL